MEQPYIPIPCGFHDRLLHWATRKEAVEAVLLENGRTVQLKAVIADVFTREGAEYILFETGQQFRLDALVEVNGLMVRDDSCAI
jgi:transcriptional antiterminator Rof (Rho-off)